MVYGQKIDYEVWAPDLGPYLFLLVGVVLEVWALIRTCYVIGALGISDWGTVLRAHGFDITKGEGVRRGPPQYDSTTVQHRSSHNSL